MSFFLGGIDLASLGDAGRRAMGYEVPEVPAPSSAPAPGSFLAPAAASSAPHAIDARFARLPEFTLVVPPHWQRDQARRAILGTAGNPDLQAGATPGLIPTAAGGFGEALGLAASLPWDAVGDQLGGLLPSLELDLPSLGGLGAVVPFVGDFLGAGFSALFGGSSRPRSSEVFDLRDIIPTAHNNRYAQELAREWQSPVRPLFAPTKSGQIFVGFVPTESWLGIIVELQTGAPRDLDVPPWSDADRYSARTGGWSAFHQGLARLSPELIEAVDNDPLLAQDWGRGGESGGDVTPEEALEALAELFFPEDPMAYQAGARSFTPLPTTPSRVPEGIPAWVPVAAIRQNLAQLAAQGPTVNTPTNQLAIVVALLVGAMRGQA